MEIKKRMVGCHPFSLFNQILIYEKKILLITNFLLALQRYGKEALRGVK